MAQATPSHPTACLALADGTIFYGHGFGATGRCVAELCFNTAMTGYQEIMTDPSYAGQIVTFTFPHIGNTGVNAEDDETAEPVAEGMVVKWDPTSPSSWRSTETLSSWLASRKRIAIGGVDTRRLTRAIRQQGAPHVALEHNESGNFDTDALVKAARDFAGLEAWTLQSRLHAHNPTGGTKCAGLGLKATKPKPNQSIKSSRLTTVQSATFCGASLPLAAKW